MIQFDHKDIRLWNKDVNPTIQILPKNIDVVREVRSAKLSSVSVLEQGASVEFIPHEIKEIKLSKMSVSRTYTLDLINDSNISFRSYLNDTFGKLIQDHHRKVAKLGITLYQRHDHTTTYEDQFLKTSAIKYESFIDEDMIYPYIFVDGVNQSSIEEAAVHARGKVAQKIDQIWARCW